MALPLALLACGAGEADSPVIQVHVPPGASFAHATDSLVGAGLVTRPRLFRAYARITGADRQIRPGVYGFPVDIGWRAILRDLQAGRVLTFNLVIPEGWELRQISQRLGSQLELPEEEVFAWLTEPDAAERFGVPGPTLEGYLFPATYELPVGISLDAAVTAMVERYKSVWTSARTTRADSLDMTKRQVMTLASIVEREAKLQEELPVISAVFHNRLRRGYLLQADATVQYALGSRRDRLLWRDIRSVADHPYNTYHHAGLPPGPIGAPGDAAIDATLSPAPVDYMYFVALPDGSHIFSHTNAEHNRARNRANRLWAAHRREEGR